MTHQINIVQKKTHIDVAYASTLSTGNSSSALGSEQGRRVPFISPTELQWNKKESLEWLRVVAKEQVLRRPPAKRGD